jgi:hypothetical protein
MDARGITVAMAGGPNIFVGSNKVVVATHDDPNLLECLAPPGFAKAWSAHK